MNRPHSGRRGPGHVVWDWNGTLLDDLPLSVAAAQYACHTVASEVVVTLDGYRAGFRRPVRLFYEHLVGRRLGDLEWARLATAYHDFYEARARAVELRVGARQLLTRLIDSPISSSLLSMSETDQLRKVVDHHDLAWLFEAIQGAHGHQRTDGKRDLLRAHVAQIRRQRPELSTADLLLVGDTTDDARAAMAVGIRAVILDDGCVNRAELRQLNVPLAADLTQALAIGWGH